MAKRERRTDARRPSGVEPQASAGRVGDAPEVLAAQQSSAVAGESPTRRRRSAFDAATAPVKPREEFLTLWIDGEEYAVPIRRALEIVRCESVTRVPRTPRWWRGVMNLRGAVIPVVDLAVRFGLQETALSSRSCVVIVEVDWTGERVALGLLTERVGQVMALARDELEAVPPVGTRIRPELLAGLIKAVGHFAPVLDVDRVLSPDQLGAQAGEAPEPPASLADRVRQVD
jgi:chemotaxis signal transduction protein